MFPFLRSSRRKKQQQEEQEKYVVGSIAKYVRTREWTRLESFLHAHPDAVRVYNSTVLHPTTSMNDSNTNTTLMGWTLLHDVLYHHPTAPCELIRTVVACDLSALTTINTVHETPLHLVCDRAHPCLERIHVLLCSNKNNCLLQRDSFGRTSFFLACANQVPLATLLLFVQQEPLVLWTRDIFGEGPLHAVGSRLYGYGCPPSSRTIWDTFCTLVSMAWKWKHGHKKQKRRQQRKRSKNYYSHPPESVMNEDTMEWKETYVLHAALDVIPKDGRDHHFAYPSFMDAVIQNCSLQALYAQDAHGNLPLHRPDLSPYQQALLLKRAPMTARQVNHRHELPLHTACGSQNQQLLAAYPQALVQKIQEWYPVFHVAQQPSSSVSTLYFLLRRQPEVVLLQQQHTGDDDKKEPLLVEQCAL